MQETEEKMQFEDTIAGKMLFEKRNYDNYLLNLKGFFDLIERYTIADLKTMIYDVPNKDSGGCCYPAVQTLVSLMELLGKLLDSSKKERNAFTLIFERLGDEYRKNGLAGEIYSSYRSHIAHNSLSKGGVYTSKSGDGNFHLKKHGQQLDVRIFFEDFIAFLPDFIKELSNEQQYNNFTTNLKQVFSSLNLKWQTGTKFSKEIKEQMDRAMMASTLASTSQIKTTVSGTSTSEIRPKRTGFIAASFINIQGKRISDD